MRARLMDSPATLDGLRPAWAELATACRLPGSLPAWQLAWWRHVAPPGAELRVIAVEDGDGLAGLAPFWAQRRGPRVDYSLLASSTTYRLGVLARPGVEREVARLATAELAEADPPPDRLTFEAVDARSPWPRAIADHWPGDHKPWRYSMMARDAPTLHLDGLDYEAWLGSKSANFRQQMRRLRRRLERQGATVRMTGSSDDVEADVADFLRLHHLRWAGRGGSQLPGAIGEMLSEAGRAMVPEGSFRMWTVELEGKPISAQLFLAADGEVMYWNGGFDPHHARLRPALGAILAAIEDAFARGERRVDFGGEADHYKLRFANGNDPIAWTGLVPHGSRYPLTRASLVPSRLARAGKRTARRLLGPERLRRVRRGLAR